MPGVELLLFAVDVGYEEPEKLLDVFDSHQMGGGL